MEGAYRSISHCLKYKGMGTVRHHRNPNTGRQAESVWPDRPTPWDVNSKELSVLY